MAWKIGSSDSASAVLICQISRLIAAKSCKILSMRRKSWLPKGPEVIIPMGVTQCPVHIKPDWLQEQLGVPVVEGIGAPIRIAAMLASLDLKQSRVRWPKSRN